MMSENVTIERRFSEAEIAQRVASVARAIREESGDEEVILVAVLRGSAVLLADLLRALPGPVRYHFVDVIYDENGMERSIHFVSHFEIENRKVYLLKDVVATGVVDHYLLNQLRARNPRSIGLVALLERPNERRLELKVDHTLFEVGEEIFAGYGLEHEGKFENLPYIGSVSTGNRPRRVETGD